jgi:hypothetical protein
MAAAATPDLVQVQLSAAGIAFAGTGAQVIISNAHYSYSFAPGKPVKVLTSEWRRSLSLRMFDGQPVLEVASSPAKATPGRVISPGASHTDAPEQPVKATQPAAEASAAEPEVK